MTSTEPESTPVVPAAPTSAASSDSTTELATDTTTELPVEHTVAIEHRSADPAAGVEGTDPAAETTTVPTRSDATVWSDTPAPDPIPWAPVAAEPARTEPAHTELVGSESAYSEPVGARSISTDLFGAAPDPSYAATAPTAPYQASDYPATAYPTTEYPATAYRAPEPVSRPSGPHSGPILLGLICLAVAVLTIARQTSGYVVHWSSIGPGLIVAAGVVFLLVGALGLIRRQH